MTINTDRLHRIADILEKVNPEQFNMNWWGKKVAHGCGTVCCAMGWAAQDPELQAQGLKFIAPLESPSDEFEATSGTIVFEEEDGLAAAAAFIGEEMVDGDWPICNALFLSSPYDSKSRDPRYVAKCIRHAANGGEVPDYEDGSWLNIVQPD